MKFDLVHDAQSIFRSLLAANSFPGTLRDISAESSRIDPELGVDPRLAVLALVLLDGEVSFSWLGDDSGNQSLTIAKLCSSEAKPAPEADFVFAASGASSLVEAISKAKEGTLVDPERGATVIALADSLAAAGSLVARGPGIKGEANFMVGFEAGSSDGWLEARAERNVEFPLGVDLILVDRAGGLMAFPRSTNIGRV
jgi:alpha-D-ribose 1-methylphosphonate 5-triphosphate synthase subunit PhnH